MLQKLLWLTLIFIELKITVDAAVYIIPAQKKPPKYACYDGCYIKELDKILAYDEPYFPRDGKSCLQYKCSKKDNSTTVFSCGAIGFPDSCERVPGNKYLAYPDCCDSFRCFAVDPVRPAEPEPVIDPIETDPIEEPVEEYPDDPTVSDPIEPVPDTDTVDPVLVDPVPEEPNPNNPPATYTNPIVPTDPQPLPNPPLPPTKQPLPTQPLPIRPHICPLDAANGAGAPPYCPPIIIRPIPVPATTA